MTKGKNLANKSIPKEFKRIPQNSPKFPKIPKEFPKQFPKNTKNFDAIESNLNGVRRQTHLIVFGQHRPKRPTMMRKRRIKNPS